jgi:hypothetical protein
MKLPFRRVTTLQQIDVDMDAYRDKYVLCWGECFWQLG